MSQHEQQFRHDEHLGWVCHCGAKENVPVTLGNFKVVDDVIQVHTHFHGPVKVTMLACLLCGCQAQFREARAFIDMEATVLSTNEVSQEKNG